MTPLRKAGCFVLWIGATLLWPSAAQAQFSAFESIFERLTDVNFYLGSNLSSDALRDHDLNISQFGVELLYGIGARTRPAALSTDTVEWVWTQTEVRLSGGRADTVYQYRMEVKPSPRDTLLTLELGLGYGQISGIEIENEGLTVQGSVREFPAASIYISHKPTALYAGLRSGLIEAMDLHAYNASGETTRAEPSAFQFGAVTGFAPEFGSLFPFLELGWVLREFGSVDWDGDVVPPSLPRRIDISGWQIVAGLQVRMRS